MTIAPSTKGFQPVTVVAGLLLAAGAWASLHAFQRGGVDFLSFRIMADGIAHGINVYDTPARVALAHRYGLEAPLGMYYPPATGVLLLPFALLPYGVAKTAWFLLMNATIVFGVRALVRHAAPDAPAASWMASVGLVLLSASLRWGMMLLQGAPLMLGLLCWFVACLDGKRAWRAAVLGIVATAFKMTLALPFLGLLLLRRRLVAIVLAGIVTIALNAFGFWRFGPGSFSNYQHDVASLDALGDQINTPDPFLPVALPRLDWVFLLYGLTRNLPLSRALSLAACAAVALLLLRAGLRAPATPTKAMTALFCAALVCLGSLCVYHHQYDLVPFAAPLLLAYFARDRGPWPRAGVLAVAPLVAIMTLLPIGAVEAWILPVFGAGGIVALKLSFPISVTLALGGSLVLLERQLAFENRTAASSSPAFGRRP